MEKSKRSWNSDIAGRATKMVGWCGGILALILALVFAGVYREGAIENLQTADAIVVLGAAEWGGLPSPIFQARLDRAFDLFIQKYAPLIILTGGKGRNSIVSEAEAGKEYLIMRGIESEYMVIEEESRTTVENLRYVSSIIEEHDLHSILLVSHDFHIMRAKKIAEDNGITVFPAPVKARNELSKFKYSLRETLMYLLYFFFGV